MPAAVVVPAGAVDLGHSVFFTLPDGYTSVPSGEGSINITNGTFSMQAAVVVRLPGEDPITVLQEYINTFDPTFESVAYTQTNIRPVDTSGVVPGDGLFLFYRELDNNGTSGAQGTIEVFRRGDGLTLLTDVYNSIDDQSGTAFPQGSIDGLRTSLLAAPLVGNPVELTALTATRTTSVHEPFEVDGLVRLTPPAGWTVKLPGPGLVWFSRPDGQTFVAGRVADLADLEAAKSLGQADVLKLQPTAVFENAIDFSDPVAYNFTTAYWHATDPTGQLISGSISIWFNPNSGEAYEALQFWVGATDVPPSTLESTFFFQSFYASINSSR